MQKRLQRPLLMGIGLLSITRDKAQALIDELVRYGEASRDEAKGLVDKLVERGEEEKNTLRKLIREEVEKALREIHIATQSDVEALREQVEALNQVEACIPAAEGNDKAAPES